ncbi:MAG: PEP-CTERM sorting domain-containing protein [Planctomycetaceae bacterium]|nr:PEP-CTERM sorting domain-containing protein [Planctomycetaceae bacterium]
MLRVLITRAALTLFSCMVVFGAVVRGEVIDNFAEVGNEVLLAFPTTGTYSAVKTGLSAANTAGGVRQTEIDLLAANGPSFTTRTASTFSWSHGPTNSQARLTYDANGAGLGGIDLTDAGNSQLFALIALGNDLGFSYTISVTDVPGSGGDTATFMNTVGAGVIGSFTQLFTDFTNAGAVDFTMIDSISVLLQGPTAANVQLASLHTAAVPEPSTLLSLSAVGGIFVMVRRRQLRFRPVN